ncbi:MAG TPA: hypothetical protein ENL22_07380, partial [candidate division Zixibacteria bacterium]|nr:hypothetical protein [candidate division Zixibacteria bacterium]
EGFDKAADMTIDWPTIDLEIRILEKQVLAMMSYIELLGAGSLAKGALKAFHQGVLDIPFSPSRYNCNVLMTARDINGAIRFINPENLPFDDETKEFHENKIHQRKVQERITKITDLLEQDLTRIWKNDYLRWPLDGNYIT